MKSNVTSRRSYTCARKETQKVSHSRKTLSAQLHLFLYVKKEDEDEQEEEVFVLQLKKENIYNDDKNN